MSRKTRNLIWSVPLVATLAIVGALALFVALTPNDASAQADHCPGETRYVYGRGVCRRHSGDGDPADVERADHRWLADALPDRSIHQRRQHLDRRCVRTLMTPAFSIRD